MKTNLGSIWERFKCLYGERQGDSNDFQLFNNYFQEKVREATDLPSVRKKLFKTFKSVTKKIMFEFLKKFRSLVLKSRANPNIE